MTGIDAKIEKALEKVDGVDLAEAIAAKKTVKIVSVPIKSDPRMGSDSYAFTPVETKPFFGAERRQPVHELQVEKAHHRLICYLAAEGNNHKEIGSLTGYSPVTIAYILKQPWALENIAQIIADKGGKAVENVLKGAALQAAQRLVTISESAKGEETRRKANNDILDRVFGKATQIIAHQNVDPADLTDEELARYVNNNESDGGGVPSPASQDT